MIDRPTVRRKTPAVQLIRSQVFKSIFILPAEPSTSKATRNSQSLSASDQKFIYLRAIFNPRSRKSPRNKANSHAGRPNTRVPHLIDRAASAATRLSAQNRLFVRRGGIIKLELKPSRRTQYDSSFFEAIRDITLAEAAAARESNYPGGATRGGDPDFSPDSQPRSPSSAFFPLAFSAAEGRCARGWVGGGERKQTEFSADGERGRSGAAEHFLAGKPLFRHRE